MESILAVGWREPIAGVAVLVGLIGNLDYFLSIKRGVTKPHLFTWLLWGLLTSIAALAQAAKGAGSGNWAMIYTAVFCFVVALMALQQGQKNITRGDWFCLATALLALPLWQLTNDPFWSVLCVSVIDVIAYIPTFRKTWHNPWQESLRPYWIANVKFVLAMLATSAWNSTTLLYPAVLIITNSIFVLMTLVRRNAQRSPT